MGDDCELSLYASYTSYRSPRSRPPPRCPSCGVCLMQRVSRRQATSVNYTSKKKRPHSRRARRAVHPPKFPTEECECDKAATARPQGSWDHGELGQLSICAQRA
jgi:hypothetical protein